LPSSFQWSSSGVLISPKPVPRIRAGRLLVAHAYV
jgi:hypothetical protein